MKEKEELQRKVDFHDSTLRMLKEDHDKELEKRNELLREAAKGEDKAHQENKRTKKCNE